MMTWPMDMITASGEINVSNVETLVKAMQVVRRSEIVIFDEVGVTRYPNSNRKDHDKRVIENTVMNQLMRTFRR